MNDLKIIITAILASISCSLLGVFLVLRNLCMISDAITHAVLPGIVLMFLISSSKSTFLMIFGASIVGVLCNFLIEYLNDKVKVQSDASIGINFTFLFAIGIILISFFAKKVDLDPDCIIYGEIGYCPFDIITTKNGLNLGPKSFYVFGFLILLNFIFIKIFYRGLKISTFDKNFSKSIGINTAFYHYLLMILCSINSVATFEISGAILSVAFMILPAATSYLLSKNLKNMIYTTILISICIPPIGFFISMILNSSISATISTAYGILFFIVFFFKRRKS
jgi:manganese/zinc/iron transport system permease protein